MFARRILALTTLIAALLTALTIAGATSNTAIAGRFLPGCYATHSCQPGTLV
jgi:hypothetical protein